MSSTIHTTAGEKPIDPYKAKNIEDPPLAQKIEDLVDFISEAKFGMLTTKISGSDLLTSRCMALAGKEHGGIDLLFHINLFSSKTLDITTHPQEVNMSFLDQVSGSWASISGTASIVADRALIEKLEAKLATYAVARRGIFGRAIETVKSATKGDVPAINSIRELSEEELAEWRRTH
ncbi:hypothetical protein BBP40_005552 [Aspergillus hancockii]|nr:hypothetical protein BBP40_005552 [Aspergillus hancockii]